MWLSKLMGYTFEIQYKQGKENVAADALSRVSGSQFLRLTLSQIHNGFYEELKLLWDTDPTLKQLISEKPSLRHTLLTHSLTGNSVAEASLS